ncbi:MAG: TCP-1/cpn60 chaperonin family protein [Candidatus Methylacidiphilaceae bacterium]
MKTHLLSGFKAFEAIRTGMEDFAKTAERSLGPCGRSTLIEHVGKLVPNVVKDGITLARSLEYREREKNVGLRILVRAARDLDEEFSDGVCTLVVVLASLLREIARATASGIPIDPILEGLRNGAEETSALLQTWMRPVEESDLPRLLPSAVAGESNLVGLVCKAFDKVGVDGNVSAEIGNRFEDEVEIIAAARYDRGFLSSAFLTDREALLVDLENPLLLLTDLVLDDFEALVPALNLAAERKRAIAIIAAGFAENVRTALIINHLRGRVRCTAGLAPAFGDTRSDFVGDLAAVTGGRAFLEARGDALRSIQFSDFGECERLKMTEDTTEIVGGRGSEETKKRRAEQIRAQLAFESSRSKSFMTHMGLRESAEDRIGLLQGLRAELRVGGVDDVARKYRLTFAKKAVGVSQSLLRGGAVPGAGAAFTAAALHLQELADRSSDLGFCSGLQAMAAGLLAPRVAIFRNRGVRAPQEAALALDRKNPWIARELKGDRPIDLWQAGIADPHGLAARIVEVAASNAKLLCRTGAVIVRRDEEIDFSDEEAAATREAMR